MEVPAYLDPAVVIDALLAGPAVVYFTKRDGSERRMVTAPAPEGVTVRTAKDGQRFALVLDAEAGQIRQVNVTRTTSFVRLAAPARPPVAPQRRDLRTGTVAQHAADIFG